MARVVLADVSRVYSGQSPALDRLNLEVRNQELLALVGPSGCGKSTTLRLIAGLEEPSSGEVLIGDRSMRGVPPKDRDVAMVFQNYALYPHLNVFRNLAFGLQLRSGGGPLTRMCRRLLRPQRAREMARLREEIPLRVQQAAARLGISHLLQRLPGQLSGGERQRVALGRAMVRRPAVFLLDEPLSNLDARLRVELRRELKQLHEQLAATMVYVTHDQVEALTLGQRVAVLDRGRLQQVGTPQQVYDEPANRFVAEFLGSPPMNVLPASFVTVSGEPCLRLGDQAQSVGRWLHRSPARRRDAAQRAWAAGKTLCGIRPEDVRLGTVDPGPEWCGPWQATVSLLEPLGDVAVVHASLAPDGGGSPAGAPMIVFKVARDACPAAGQSLAWWFAGDRAHWFEASNGQNWLREGN